MSPGGLFAGLIGRCVIVTRYEHTWGFSFGQGWHIMVSTLWRVRAYRLLLTSEDDHQKFGLPEPIDAEREANVMLADQSVAFCDWDESTGDLRIGFSSDVMLEIVATSSGYESWVAQLGEHLVVGRVEI